MNLTEDQEWLETNGLGGYASSTICGMNTRRYHGLLVASLQPPTARYVLLSKTEECFVLNGRSFELGTNRYPGVIHPAGYELQSSFRLDPFPVFTWQIEDIELYKTVFLVHGENTVVIRWLLRAQGEAARHHCTLHVRPLIAFRDFHQLTHENSALNPTVTQEPNRARIQPYPDLPALHFAHDAEACEPSGTWYRRFQYSKEQERGLDYEEDLFQPLALHFDLTRRIQATVIASTEPRNAADAGDLRSAERDRRKLFSGTFSGNQADRFLVQRGTGKSLIAGYHWFADWSRDTMIALPHLFSTPVQRESAKEILLQFAGFVSEGMLPNRFPDQGETPEYNTVDGTLWFFEAVRALLDRAFILQHFLPLMEEIIKWHLKGTRFDIHATGDGLLHSGEQLTWMDARVNGVPVTPRDGKAVEIQALWYNALMIMNELKPEGPYRAIAEQAKQSFVTQFWNGEYLDDVAGDHSLRPNQLIAISLEHKILDDPEKSKAILKIAEEHLLTPYGLRTLSPKDPRYKPRYEGSAAERDAAYHQGTVWPWLLGPYIAAGGNPNSLKSLTEYRDGPGQGNTPEIFDGDPPHTPRGAISQAWSNIAPAYGRGI